MVYLALTAFVALNLFQLDFTNFCPMDIIWLKLCVPAVVSLAPLNKRI